MKRRAPALLILLALLVGGCANTPPYDYSALRERPPRSILVLPPMNQSMAAEGTYGYLSTVSRPLAELGYYVFPVEVVDHFMKENGLPSAGEMHEVPLAKIAELIGADAVLYPTLVEYGTRYQVFDSVTQVKVAARLVDTRTGTLLWEGTGVAAQEAGGNSLLEKAISAAITQVLNTRSDAAHNLAPTANYNLFYAKNRGLPWGPYSPNYGKEP